MKINQITEDFSVSPQLKTTDLAKIKRLGFKTIICNRPNGEEIGQQRYQAIEQAAIENDLKFIYLPITTTEVAKQAANQFKKHLKELPAPILAYCRTGTRSAVLWSFSQIEQRGKTAVINKTQAAGYDITEALQGQ